MVSSPDDGASLLRGIARRESTGTPVSEDYKVPFKFTGKSNKVVIEVK